MIRLISGLLSFIASAFLVSVVIGLIFTIGPLIAFAGVAFVAVLVTIVLAMGIHEELTGNKNK